MDGKLANLVVTDPPYNVNYEGLAGKIKNDNKIVGNSFPQGAPEGMSIKTCALTTLQNVNKTAYEAVIAVLASRAAMTA